MPISQSNSTAATLNDKLIGDNTNLNSTSQYATIHHGGNNNILRSSYSTISSGYSNGCGGIFNRYLTPNNQLITDTKLQPNTVYYLTTDVTGLQWQSIAPVNEEEIVIDITKATVEICDFTKKKVLYNLKQLKTKYISNKEINCVDVEREVLPGDLKQLKSFKDSKEILLEFEGHSDNERYGKKYVSKLYDHCIDNFDFPIIHQGQPMTIVDGLNINIQPLGAPNGNLFHIDPVFTTNPTITINPTIYGNGTTVTGIANSDTFPQGLHTGLIDNQTYTIGNIQTVLDDTDITTYKK